MGIGVGQASLLRVLENKGVLASLNTVCELGSQVPIPSELKITLFDSIGKQAPGESYDARQFYKSLGLEQYSSIDLDGMYGALEFDLNLDLQGNYEFYNTFDLVTNFGTTEHCFNQGVVYRNIHNLCKAGGYMLHTVPSQAWVGHSFYRYDENFFKDMAVANSYKLMYLRPYTRLQPRRLNSIRLLRTSPMRYLLKQIELLTGRVRVNTTLLCILRKVEDADFVVPIQGMYQKSCKQKVSENKQSIT